MYNLQSAGSGATAVTPGFYYYDGSKWQRIINQQPDATVEFGANADPNTAGATFEGTAASKNFVYVSTIDGSQWTYNGSTYVTYTPPPSTGWYLTGGTKDAGSNKTSSVYRTGSVGIGASTTVSASAILDVNASNKGFLPPCVALTGSADVSTIASPATGLLVYNTATAGTKPNDVIPGYYYYNGTNWVTIGSTTVESWSSTIVTSPNITLGAVTTAPTKSTTRTTDYVRFKKIGDKQYAVEYKYFVSTQSGSTAGSGDYLFTLPGGLRFNSIEHPFFTSANRYGDSWGYQLLESNVIVSHDGSWGIAAVIPYDATRFRLALVSGGSSTGQASFVSSGYYAQNQANYSLNISFKFYAQ